MSSGVTNTCPQCGEPMPPQTGTEDLCQNCLLELGLQSDARDETDSTLVATPPTDRVGATIGPYRV